MGRLQTYLNMPLLLMLLVPAAHAVMGGDDELRPPTLRDADYAAGITAFEAADWQGVIDNMLRVIERRPWHDNAHNALGYAYRQLGDYPQALEYYRKALELNPHNRGALEYLGEAYLELDRLIQAEELLARLERECRRIARSTANWQSDCEEWLDLKEAIDAYRKNSRR